MLFTPVLSIIYSAVSFALESCFCIAYGSFKGRTFNLVIRPSGTLGPARKLSVPIRKCVVFAADFYLLVWLLVIAFDCHNLRVILSESVQKLCYKNSLPGVSIIKPLVGVDSNLISNLTTFFFLNYPKYEILFCVHDASDSSLPIVRSLVEKYPHVPAKVFIGGTTVGLNPKINNMMPGYVAAQYQLILISDSGLRMKKEALLDMVMAMREDTAVVTQLPFTYDRKGFAAMLEKVYFGTAHARIYLTAHALGIVCSTGMSSLLRKSVLDEAGGIQAFGKYIAEDYFFAKNAKSKGWKCAISSLPALQNSGICSVTHFHDRLTRWARLRFAMLPYTVVLEPLQECILLGVLTMPAASYIFGWNCAIFFLAHVFCWLFLDCVLLSIVQGYCVTCGQMRLLFAWLYRELSASSVFVRAAWNQTIHWRTATFRLRWGGVAELVQS
ncbi:Ceramide glucosyltransferase-B [Trichinella papuae]|uniref:ceramide glucosyltransferase n=1 Tax=Trichinella papuae TaxID=268474 RepID=A0A0V1N7V4_9BILA|nr:Ceramide glucosyltransferase-B [Trichinella papuae]